MDRKAIFASERAGFEADYPELAHQIPCWIDIATRAFAERAELIEQRAAALTEVGTPATEAQVLDAMRLAARLSLVDTAAMWQRGDSA